MLLLLPSDMLLLLLQHLLLVALLVAPLRGAPAAPAPSLASGVEEEGGRQAEEAKLRRLPTGSIVAPLSRAELFQRPRPRYVWLQLCCWHCSVVGDKTQFF